jgi:hypothetical protein
MSYGKSEWFGTRPSLSSICQFKERVRSRSSIVRLNSAFPLLVTRKYLQGLQQWHQTEQVNSAVTLYTVSVSETGTSSTDWA